MAEDKELVLPTGLEVMAVDPPDKLRLRPPAPLPSDIIPLLTIHYFTMHTVYSYYINRCATITVSTMCSEMWTAVIHSMPLLTYGQ